jgi:hypothetical protein
MSFSFSAGGAAGERRRGRLRLLPSPWYVLGGGDVGDGGSGGGGSLQFVLDLGRGKLHLRGTTLTNSA